MLDLESNRNVRLESTLTRRLSLSSLKFDSTISNYIYKTSKLTRKLDLNKCTPSQNRSVQNKLTDMMNIIHGDA